MHPAVCHERRGPRRRTAAVLAIAVVLVACSSDEGGETPPPTTVVVPDVTELAPPRTDDGVLKIGVLLPRTGPGAAIGEPLINTIETAVDAINDAGGAIGRPVRLVIRDEGIDQAAADLASDDLINDEEVDVIIGPGSSRIAVATAPTIVESGILACSPLATSMQLTSLPDDGLFIRTIGSDRLQARAMARLADGTGFRAVSLVFPDDVYGRAFGAAVRDAVAERGLTLVAEHAYDPTGDDFTAVAESVMDDEPPVVALIGSADNGSRVFTAIENAATGSRPLVVANDSIRDSDVVSLLSTDSRIAALLTGVSLEPFSGSTGVRALLGLAPEDPVPAFASAAIDCVNLAALAAEQTGTDSPATMADVMVPTTRGGTSCQAFSECKALLDAGLDIDYDGPTGLLSLDDNGDVVQAEFIDYYFDADGVDTTTERFLVSGA